MKRTHGYRVILLLAMLLTVFMAATVSAGQNAITISSKTGSFSVAAGKTLQLHLSIGGSENTTTGWRSANTSVATVSSSGLLKGISAGTAEISCDSGYGFRVSETITVTGQSTTASKQTTSKQTGLKKKVYLKSYLTKSYTKLIKKVPTVTKLSKSEDPAGIGNVYVFELEDGTSPFIRYNMITKKITFLQNDAEKKLVFYGVKIGTKVSTAKKWMKKYKWKYVSKSAGGGGYWLEYKKEKSRARLLIVNKKVSCYQWMSS